jgi:5-methylcytosine-specific restriction endonuclease McrA
MGFYERYLRSEHWREFRKLALEHYGNKCAVCGSTKNLNVHHLDYSSFGEEHFEDVQVLCKSCHLDEHFDELLRKHCRHPRTTTAEVMSGKTVTLLRWCVVCNQAIGFRKATPEEIEKYKKKKIEVDKFCL